MKFLENEHGISPHLSPYRMRPERRNDGYEYCFYLADPIPDVDSSARFLISECLFNVRSALDQLVYQLHVRRYKGRVPDAAERTAMFPILRRPRTKPHAGIAHLSSADRRAIMCYQPYIKRNDDLNKTREVLGALESIHNIDKHRRLHVARAILQPVHVDDHWYKVYGLRQHFDFTLKLDVGTCVERWTFVERPPHAELIKDTRYCWPRVVIDEPTLNVRVYVADFLQEVFGHVAAVVQRFNARFGYAPWERWRESPHVASS